MMDDHQFVANMRAKVGVNDADISSEDLLRLIQIAERMAEPMRICSPLDGDEERWRVAAKSDIEKL